MSINFKNIPFEDFEGDLSRESKPTITIGRGSLKEPNSAYVYRFNKGLVTKYNLDRFTHCKLSFSKQYAAVSFTFLSLKDDQKIPPWYSKITKDENVRKISARRFARKWRIYDDNFAGKYPSHERSVGRNSLALGLLLSEKNKI